MASITTTDHAEASHDVAVGVAQVGPVGQGVELDDALVEPFLVPVLGSELGLDLVVADDATLGGVDQEHATGLEAALLHDLVGGDVEQPGLGT